MSAENPYPDQTGYDSHYGGVQFDDLDAGTAEQFVANFEERFAQPLHDGGWVHDGECMHRVLEILNRYCSETGKKPNQVTLLDAGSGLGHTSVFFAAKGFNVISVEISAEGVAQGRLLANNLAVKCVFLQASLEDMDVAAGCVDVFFGRNTLHHFVKYPQVAEEFRRVAAPGAIGLYLDPYGENIFKNVFHDKARMKRLGDELLTKPKIEAFFSKERVELNPLCWFSLLNKLFVRMFGWKRGDLLRSFATVAHRLDALIPADSRLALWLAGRVVTVVQY